MLTLQLNHVIQCELSSNTDLKEPVNFAFSNSSKHLMYFQSKISVFKFFHRNIA